ncbi:MAG: hypothetical protein IK123_06315, partial [Lachnospiraceae bacterium]|nr:hypothetical protein [Lachnospiraceae bacterium]
RQLDTDIDYRERIRAHKLSVFFKTVIVIAGFIIILVVMNTLWKAKTFSDLSVQNSYPVSVVTGATARNLNGYLLISSKDGASCIDNKGKAIWNQSFEMQSPIVATCGSTVAIGDYNGRTIYVANRDRILGTVKTNLPIRSVAVSDNGVVAAVLDDTDVIRIYVYDGNSDTSDPIVQAKATMNKSGYPISVSLSPNGKIMMVSYFYVDSGNMKSSVAFYNFGEVGSNEADNYVSGYDYVDSVIPYVRFMDIDSSFGVSNDRIVFFNGKEKPINVASALLDAEVVGVYNNEEYVGLVFSDTTGQGLYRLDVYNSMGSLVGNVFFNMDYTDIIFYKDQVVIYDDNEIQMFTVKGNRKFSGMLPQNANLIIPDNSIYRYLVVGNQAMDLIELN